jgi:nucleoside 2-deoxyribosyltransferase
MTRVYLSGPMTGLPELNFPAFNAAAARLRAEGAQVVNPAEINPDGGLSWEQCMRADIKALCDCDAIVLLPGWEGSKGAHLELHVAHRLGLEVRFA